MGQFKCFKLYYNYGFTHKKIYFFFLSKEDISFKKYNVWFYCLFPFSILEYENEREKQIHSQKYSKCVRFDQSELSIHEI